MTLIDLDKFVGSFITEMKKYQPITCYNLPACIMKALEDQGLEYKDGEIIKSQRRVSAETKEAGYGESEDEKIRKSLLMWLQSNSYTNIAGIQINDVIDWFEKQGERESDIRYKYLDELLTADNIYQMSMNEAMTNEAKTKAVNALSNLCVSKLLGLEKQRQNPAEWHREDEQNLNACLGYIPDEFLRKWLTDIIHINYDKSTDKPEPKFKVGDWVVDEDDNSVRQIECVLENVTSGNFSYDLVGGGYFPSTKKNYHLWSIADAKEGDVLVASDESLFIFARAKDNAAYYHFSLCKNGSQEISDGKHSWEVAKDCHPATKEQRDTLFAKMKEAGYEWDSDEKEVMKIVTPIFNIGDRIRYKGHACDGVITEITDTDYICGDTKLPISTQDKLELVEQKSSWSEEDERIYQSIIDDTVQENQLNNEQINWLKFLKQRHTWKPSDEQINTLRDAIVYVEGCNSNFKGNGSVLENLYNNLKKLTE